MANDGMKEELLEAISTLLEEYETFGDDEPLEVEVGRFKEDRAETIVHIGTRSFKVVVTEEV